MCFDKAAKVAIQVIEPAKIGNSNTLTKKTSKELNDELSQYATRIQSSHRAFSSRRRLDFFIEKK